MKLMQYVPSDWPDVVAMRVDGAMSSWVNAILLDATKECCPPFCTWC